MFVEQIADVFEESVETFAFAFHAAAAVFALEECEESLEAVHDFVLLFGGIAELSLFEQSDDGFDIVFEQIFAAFAECPANHICAFGVLFGEDICHLCEHAFEACIAAADGELFVAEFLCGFGRRFLRGFLGGLVGGTGGDGLLVRSGGRRKEPGGGEEAELCGPQRGSDKSRRPVPGKLTIHGANPI